MIYGLTKLRGIIYGGTDEDSLSQEYQLNRPMADMMSAFYYYNIYTLSVAKYDEL